MSTQDENHQHLYVEIRRNKVWQGGGVIAQTGQCQCGKKILRKHGEPFPADPPTSWTD